jgi:hypothetical protein
VQTFAGWHYFTLHYSTVLRNHYSGQAAGVKLEGQTPERNRARREWHAARQGRLESVGLRSILPAVIGLRLGACFVSSVFPFPAPEIFTHAVVISFGTDRLTSAGTALDSPLRFSSSLFSTFSLLFSLLIKTRTPAMRASAQLSVSGYF